jgi:hypothetical protein
VAALIDPAPPPKRDLMMRCCAVGPEGEIATVTDNVIVLRRP